MVGQPEAILRASMKSVAGPGHKLSMRFVAGKKPRHTGWRRIEELRESNHAVNRSASMMDLRISPWPD